MWKCQYILVGFTKIGLLKPQLFFIGHYFNDYTCNKFAVVNAPCLKGSSFHIKEPCISVFVSCHSVKQQTRIIKVTTYHPNHLSFQYFKDYTLQETLPHLTSSSPNSVLSMESGSHGPMRRHDNTQYICHSLGVKTWQLALNRGRQTDGLHSR